MWKVFVRDYLSFSRKERAGIFLLLFLISCCMLFPFIFRLVYLKKAIDPTFEREISSLKFLNADSVSSKKYPDRNNENLKRTYPKYSGTAYDNIQAEIFYFDPNNTSAADWKRLGIKEKAIQTIQKFISHGGHFYKADDISKIWGLHPDDIQRLLPYVRLKEFEKHVTYSDQPRDYNKNILKYPTKTTPVSFDINTADTALYIALPGIGSKLAQRIIKFREKLGGFCSVDQVSETFGLPDSTFQKIKTKLMLNRPEVKQLNINTATLDELKTHPYIRYSIANAIVQYRTQHGLFTTIADLKKIMVITEEAYNKLLPYVTVGL